MSIETWLYLTENNHHHPTSDLETYFSKMFQDAAVVYMSTLLLFAATTKSIFSFPPEISAYLKLLSSSYTTYYIPHCFHKTTFQAF